MKPSKKQGLQKLSDFRKVRDNEDYNELSSEDKKSFKSYLIKKITKARGTENKLKVMEFAASIIPDDSDDLRNQVWEINHQIIVGFIHNFIRENNRMPTKTEISSEVKLSRQTITKHIKEFEKSEFAEEQMRKFKLLKPQIMTSLYRIGVDYGNVKALKVLLDVIDRSGCNQTYIENNFIQINNFILDQKQIENLSEEERRGILSIIQRHDNK